MPVNAKTIETISNRASDSLSQQRLRIAVVKILELNMTNQTLKGRILFAVAKPIKPMTCVQLLRITAGLKATGIEEKRVSLSMHFTIVPAISMLTIECMKRTSKGET